MDKSWNTLLESLGFKDPAAVYQQGVAVFHNNMWVLLFLILFFVAYLALFIVRNYGWSRRTQRWTYLWRRAFAPLALIKGYVALLLGAFYRLSSYHKAYDTFATTGELIEEFYWLCSPIPLRKALAQVPAWRRQEAFLRLLPSHSYFAPAYYNSGADWRDLLQTNAFRHSMDFERLAVFFPSAIIAFILAPSIALLYSNDVATNFFSTLNVQGHQWFWSYSEQSEEVRSLFDSTLVPEFALSEGGARLLEVDNRALCPLNTPFRFLVSSGDVLHAWAVPELGIKIDAVPGRLNDALAFIRRPGVFYGQCSELCGVGHGFMPIVVETVRNPAPDWEEFFQGDFMARLQEWEEGWFHEWWKQNPPPAPRWEDFFQGDWATKVEEWEDVWFNEWWKKYAGAHRPPRIQDVYTEWYGDALETWEKGWFQEWLKKNPQAPESPSQEG